MTNSYFKSALKYSGSNLGNQQGDLQWKSQKNPFQVGIFMFRFFGLGVLVPTLEISANCRSFCKMIKSRL